jgi:dihydroflavonol-4-reductase
MPQKPWTLVTGASGFIGSRLVHALVARGERVKAFVRPGASLRQLRGMPDSQLLLAYGDIMVEHTVYRALAGCDRMYHVATNFKMWDKRPERIIDPAVLGTKATLEAGRRRGLEKIVYTSSVASLGVAENRDPMDESHEFNLADPEIYILAKYEAEQAAMRLAEDGAPVVVVLPSAVVGPGDWKPTPTGSSILQYLKLSPNVRMPITDGGLSIVDVDDVAAGHMLAMDKGRTGERYVLGGENLGFRQLFELLSDITGLAPPGKPVSQGLVELSGRLMELKARFFGGEPQLTYRLARDYANDVVWVSSAKAEQELGYTHRPAREALTRAVNFFLEKGYVPDKAARRVRLELRPA